jgi:glycosyltransferase involved in cell wall biosynthesis
MLTVHRAMQTWKRTVDQYIALSEFARRIFVRGGLPEAKIAVKPNFVWPDPGPGEGQGGYAVFVGRVSVEKGIGVLLDCWSRLPTTMTLKVVGDGPLVSRVRERADRDDRIEWIGRQPMERVLELVGDAACLVLPSVTYEMLPKTIIEAFARGTPVVASNHGGMGDLVDQGRTGELFQAGDPDDLCAAITRLTDDSLNRSAMRQAARAAFEAKYTSQHAYQCLLSAYEQALARRHRGRAPSKGVSHPATSMDRPTHGHSLPRSEHDDVGLKESTSG